MSEDFSAAADDRIGRILDRLSKAPGGESIVTFLKLHKVDIDLQDCPLNWAASTLTITSVKDGLYYYDKPKIILKKDLTDDNLLQAIVHETGHLNQHFSHAGNPDRILSQEQYILFYRAAEADAQALTAEVTWALKQMGDTGPWDAACIAGYNDVAEAYEKAVAEDPAAASDGRAKRAAFDAWFGDADRLAGYNKSTVNYMIPSLEWGRKDIFKNHGLVEKPLDESWLRRIDGMSSTPYMHLEGFKNVLADPWYSRDTHTRPPDPPANQNNAGCGCPKAA